MVRERESKSGRGKRILLEIGDEGEACEKTEKDLLFR
jgi:hypothetical protein